MVRSSCLMAVLGVVVLALSNVDAGLAMGVSEHCNAACLNAASPSDEDARKSINMETAAACRKAFSQSNHDGKICRQHFLRAGKLACILGCENMAKGNVIANKIEIAKERQACLKYANGQYTHFSKVSCEQGVKAGTAYFSEQGLALRAKVDEMCAISNDDASEAEVAKEKEEEVVVVRSAGKPQVPKEPVRIVVDPIVTEPVVEEEQQPEAATEDSQPAQEDLEEFPVVIDTEKEADVTEENEPVLSRKLRTSSSAEELL
ncbi:Hypothetical Protein FCC1311_067442 [Hondaea fermentalgiana]|uniref:Secreted protein n=1 Tax=Hondaea fermentalgiana TaxID=2315210 RepID=A0A2R5GRL5_9STRA|nr:Hypothetical Protein FCC1311_067442 [Hondaea fermentalgiana]|eukprot:GBG30524.1 Hypothetical Protein FCC1311_067442 [Hondaea fermentalgiana]